ncbi:MAG: M3 family metallopeptidase, partial [Prolixibacteraceae bacterium]|nr:M3 family metallopeptidase [Prolixibacteraceae bacterium]
MNENKNPLLGSTNTPYNSVPFNLIKPSHFEPAFNAKIDACKKEFKRIINNREAATLQNTLVPFELKYDEVSRLGLILFNLNSAETSDQIQAVTQKISPLLTKFSSKVLLNKKYFSRIEIIYNNRTKTKLNTEELRLIETTYLSMKRNGAKLNFIQKMRLTQIQMKLAKLTLKFDDNILAETNDYIFHTEIKEDLDGLPENELIAASLLAKSKGKKGWIVTLQYPSYAPFLKYANKRKLREKIYKANSARGNRDNNKDNKKLIVRISNLRLQQAKMLGYKTYADYVLEERMAQTPQKVNSFLEELHSASQPFAVKE